MVRILDNPIERKETSELDGPKDYWFSSLWRTNISEKGNIDVL